MASLEELRLQLDEIDDQMVRLYEDRQCQRKLLLNLIKKVYVNCMSS